MRDSGRAAHDSSRAVAGSSERLLHAPLLSNEHPTGPAHVARDDHGLTDGLVLRRRLGMMRGKRPRGTLAMDPDFLLLAIYGVLFELRDVVSHIVNQAHLQRFPAFAECQ